MSRKDIQEEAVLAAVKPLKNVESAADHTNSTVNSSELSGNRMWPRQATDADARTSEAGSLEKLFQLHHDRVFRTAYRVTGSPADAEDVLQTVFLRVVRGHESAETAENPSAYFARAAINASLDLLRGRKRSKAVAFDDVENQAGLSSFVSHDDPAARQEDRELRELIRTAVSHLGSTAAEMFALRYFEGLGNAEIAGVMNTSPLVVGVTLHRARARLRKEIGKYVSR